MYSHTLLLLSDSWTKGLQLFAGLSLLIILHEFGHFFFAKLFKTKVEKFYLFFDFLFPISTLLPFSLFKKKIGETEYGIGWFPLGGYVKIAGMVDESMDKEQLALPPQPWEYRSKKPWQKLLIMLGGIIVNLLVAMLIYMLVFKVYGDDYLPTTNAKYGIMVDSVGEQIGLRNGDKIMTIDNKKIDHFDDIYTEIVANGAQSIQVDRAGELLNIKLPVDSISKYLDSKSGLFHLRIPLVVDNVSKGTAASKMGLIADDSIVAANGQPIHFFDEFDKFKKSNLGQPIRLTVVRNHQLALLDGVLPTDGMLGFMPVSDGARFYEFKHNHYTIFQAIHKGFAYTWEKFGAYAHGIKLMFTSKDVKISKNLGGIVSFAKIFPAHFVWHDFWMLVALISIILAFMNLLPIPGLDGGYVVFLLWEIITGRKVNDKVMEIATSIGLMLLLALMLYANGLDIFRLFSHK